MRIEPSPFREIQKMGRLGFLMSVLIIFNLSCVTTPSLKPKIEKLEAPVLNVGDRWKFKSPDGYLWIDEVVDIKANEYLIKIEGTLLRFDKKTMNVIKSPIPFWETHGKRLNFPFYVGKKWTYTTRKAPYGQTREVTYLNEFNIGRYEEVLTLAGKFMAYKIDYRQTSLDTINSGRIEFWYSPEIKWFVKRRVEMTPYWPATTWVQDFVLVEYQLK